jgi:type IV fimbrial biogenesis protein FimT
MDHYGGLLGRAQGRRLLMGRRLHRGFTLVEMLVAVAIAALLIVMAAPQYALWIADAHIRSAAESIASGLRWAQAEAIKRNTPVEFILNPTTATGGWNAHVVTDAAGVFVQTGSFAEGAGNSQFVVIPAGTTTVTFSGLGVVSPVNADASVALTRVAITTVSTLAGTRPLTVLVGGGRTGIKICDPNVSIPATDPRFCTT